MISALELLRINHANSVMAIAFSPDNRYFATAGLDATTSVWEVHSGLEVLRADHEDIIVGIAFSRDGRYFATASEDLTAQVWEVHTGRRVACLAHEDSVSSVTFQPGGEHLVTITGSKVFPLPQYTASSLSVWDIITGRRIMHITHNHGVNAFAFGLMGKYLAIACSDRALEVWKVIDSQKLALAPEDEVNDDTAFYSKKRNLVRCDRSACEWRVDTNAPVARMVHECAITAVTFSPDSQHLATVCSDDTVRVWKVNSGLEIARLPHKQHINAVAFSQDGKYLATASDNHTVRVWEVSKAQEVTRLTFENKINDIIFSWDGQLLATATGDLMSSGRQESSTSLWLWRPEDLSLNPA